jgi:hypothetical protein
MTSKQVAALYLFEAVTAAAEDVVRDMESGALDEELVRQLDQAGISRARVDRIANEVRKMVGPIREGLARKAKVDYAMGWLAPK